MQPYMSVVAGSGRQDFATALATLLQSNQRLANAGAGGAPYAHKRLASRGIARSFDDLYGTISRQGPRSP
jgi:hypothetical protein